MPVSYRPLHDVQSQQKKNISTVRANERPKILDNQRIAIGGSPVSGFGSCYSPNPSPRPRPHPSSK